MDESVVPRDVAQRQPESVRIAFAARGADARKSAQSALILLSAAAGGTEVKRAESGNTRVAAHAHPKTGFVTERKSNGFA